METVFLFFLRYACGFVDSKKSKMFIDDNVDTKAVLVAEDRSP